MTRLLLIAAALALAGCETTPKSSVVVEYKYIVRKATDEQKAIPANVPNIDPKRASQADLAEWIANSERRTWRLESIIAELVRFYERDLTPEEKAIVEKAAGGSTK